MNKPHAPEAAETVQTKEIPAVDLPRRVRARVQAKLDKAAKSLEEALDIARAGGWEQAEGFISGEGIGCCIHVFPGEPDSGHPHAISSEALEWQCGGW